MMAGEASILDAVGTAMMVQQIYYGSSTGGDGVSFQDNSNVTSDNSLFIGDPPPPPPGQVIWMGTPRGPDNPLLQAMPFQPEFDLKGAFSPHIEELEPPKPKKAGRKVILD